MDVVPRMSTVLSYSTQDWRAELEVDFCEVFQVCQNTFFSGALLNSSTKEDMAVDSETPKFES